MFNKEQFIHSVRMEANICKHLYEKIPADSLSWRPTPSQRSVLELLQYLAACCVVPTQNILKNDWSQVRDTLAQYQSLPAEDFPDMMDKQVREVEKLLQPYSDQELLDMKTSTPMGTESAVGSCLVNLPLKFLAAYRMQLFLYLKLLGVENLSTSNLWAGMDRPQQS